MNVNIIYNNINNNNNKDDDNNYYDCCTKHQMPLLRADGLIKEQLSYIAC